MGQEENEFYDDDDDDEEEYEKEKDRWESQWDVDFEKNHPLNPNRKPAQGLRPPRRTKPPVIEPEQSQPEQPKKSWQQKLREKTLDEVITTDEKKRKRILDAVMAKWKRTKIRRPWKHYETTDRIRDILTSNPHKKNKKNYLIKANLIREVNQYMLDILDCLITDEMTYRESELPVRRNWYGLKKELFPAHVKSKLVYVKRVPILVELNVPAIVGRINFKRAKQGLRPIKEGVIKKSLQGLEAEGFVKPVGKKIGKKGRLRMIGSYYLRETLTIDPYTEKEIERYRTGKAYFWGASQPDAMERLGRLEPK